MYITLKNKFQDAYAYSFNPYMRIEWVKSELFIFQERQNVISVLFEQANCIDWIKCTVTDRNIAFLSTPVTCYLLRFGDLVVNPVYFLLTGNIKRGNQGKII
jgi:hypothetical protein